MHARPTKHKRSFSDRLALLVAGLLLGFVAAVIPADAEAAGRVAKSGKRAAAKVHRPSKAHLKLRARLEKMRAEDSRPGSELGAASFYGHGFHGRLVATGERFDMRGMTAASNRFPLGAWLAVRRLDSERCVSVRINDRMHTHHRTRIIDLSRGAAERLKMIADGVVLVRVTRLAQKPADDSQSACLAAFSPTFTLPADCETCAGTPEEASWMPAERPTPRLHVDEETTPVSGDAGD